MIAISNMPISEIVETSLGRMYQFMESPYMSTYLLVWVIGVFEYLETISKAGVNIRVYTPKGRKMEGEFALDLTAKCIDFYSEYFNIPYPLRKLDMVSLHSIHDSYSNRNARASDGKLGVYKLCR